MGTASHVRLLHTDTPRHATARPAGRHTHLRRSSASCVCACVRLAASARLRASSSSARSAAASSATYLQPGGGGGGESSAGRGGGLRSGLSDGVPAVPTRALQVALAHGLAQHTRMHEEHRRLAVLRVGGQGWWEIGVSPHGKQGFHRPAALLSPPPAAGLGRGSSSLLKAAPLPSPPLHPCTAAGRAAAHASRLTPHLLKAASAPSRPTAATLASSHTSSRTRLHLVPCRPAPQAAGGSERRRMQRNRQGEEQQAGRSGVGRTAMARQVHSMPHGA